MLSKQMLSILKQKELNTNQLERQLAEWKSFGAVSTPLDIVELMIKLTGINDWANLDILEPACGFCNFLSKVYQLHPNNQFTGVEFNTEVFDVIKRHYNALPWKLLREDYLLWNIDKKFDLIIGNPPYGIIGDASHYAIHTVKDQKEQYKKIFKTWRGKYNIYGAFIEKSINLLKPGGKLVFIIPATWMILDDFSKLRKFLSLSGKTKVYYLGNDVFKNVSVSVSILVFEKNSASLELFHQEEGKYVKTLSVPKWTGELIKFENEYTKEIDKNKTLLSEIFDIKISARSPEVKKFPGLLEKEEKGAIPFINGRNVKENFIDRNCYVGYWLKKQDITILKNFYGVLPRIVVGHTKGGKLVAALEESPYPYIGDVYHLLPKFKMTKKQLQSIVDWFNSEEMQLYVKTLYKDISPHITSTQLKVIPIKPQIEINTLF